MSTRYYREEEYQDEHVTDGAPASRQQTSARRYPVTGTAQRPPTQRLQNEPVPARVPARRQRITNDVVSRYEDDAYGDTDDDGDFYNPYDPPTERESQLRSRRVPSRSGNTEPVRRVVPQYVDEYVERPERPVRRVYQAPARQEERISRRQLFQWAKLGGYTLLTLALVSSGTAVYALARTWINHQNGVYEEGKYAGTSLSLVCGHNDSAQNKTQLHAFVDDAARINFIEIPGGNASQSRLFQTQPIYQFGFEGNLDDLYIKIVPEIIANKYRIHLNVESRPVGVFTSTHNCSWLLIDNKGKFDVVTK